MFFFFFFSSRRRHTRLTCDWSSDVCSSDLLGAVRLPLMRRRKRSSRRAASCSTPSRSEERRVGKGVDLGGRRIINKKKQAGHCTTHRAAHALPPNRRSGVQDHAL